MATTKKASQSIVLKPLTTLLKRFHLTLFFIVIAGSLAWAVIMINGILSDDTATSDYTSPIDAGTIDQATLTRIQTLHVSDASGDIPPVPEGRINPFSE